MQSLDIGESYEQSELYKLRHAAAHVMVQAVLELYRWALARPSTMASTMILISL